MMELLINYYGKCLNDAYHVTTATSVDQLASSIYNVRTYLNGSSSDLYIAITFPVSWCNLQFKFNSQHIWIRFKWFESSWAAFKQIY